MLLQAGRFENACDLFYGAIAAPDLWPKALQAVADACGAAGAILIPIGLGPGASVCAPGIEDFIADLIAGGWETTNPRMQRGLALTRAGMKGLIADTDMFARDELPKDRYYNEFLVPHRMGATAGMVLTQALPDLVLPISIERRAADGPFTPAEVATMNRYMGHLRPAATLALQVGFSQARRFADSLSETGRDIVLFSAGGRVLHLSPSCELHIGDAFSIKGGRIFSWDGDADRALSGAIAKAIGRATTVDRVVGEVVLPRKSGRRSLRAQLVPLVNSVQDVFSLAQALMIITNPEIASRRGSVDAALAAYGLSGAERRLAGRVASGEALRSIAQNESVSIETVRSRLKAVFAKTGTHRQSELAILIADLRP